MYEGKRLSLFRLFLLMLVIIGVSVGGYYYMKGQSKFANAENTSSKASPWFAPYVDVTATPTYNFEQGDRNTQKNVILSFIVSSDSNQCEPSWGNAYSLDQASSKLDLDRRIARLRQNKVNLAVSFGGLSNQELSVSCKDLSKLINGYKQVIDRYDLNTIDLDLENAGLKDTEAMQRRAQAIATLQGAMKAKNKKLAVWLTLPVAPSGLTPEGTDAVKIMLEKGVDINGLNVMTFDYGQSQDKNDNLVESSKNALNETHRQLGILYKNANTYLSSETIWSKMGLTVMIGQTDDKNQVFDIDMAKDMNQFALDNKIGRVSMWSANRDIKCGDNYVDTKIVSTSCSGVKQEKGDFAKILGNNINGDITSSSTSTTHADQPDSKESMKDDPANSPYQIWNEDSAYPQETKVVWHHNVYEAKWWNQNEVPDNPVLQSYETPWRLVGPVLQGEKPIKQQTLPAGTYPDWTGNSEYKEGDRVIFEGIPYQAKWWNKSQSPKAASSDPAGSPWVALKQSEIQKILESLNK